MMVGRLLSYWEGNFSGAMLNFGRVNLKTFGWTTKHGPTSVVLGNCVHAKSQLTRSIPALP